MLGRHEVYTLIDNERQYQDRTYNPDEVVSSGQTRQARDLEVSPGILMLHAYILKAEDAWVNTAKTNLPALQQIAKIAAIAVRILEHAGGSEELLIRGLR